MFPRSFTSIYLGLSLQNLCPAQDSSQPASWRPGQGLVETTQADVPPGTTSRHSPIPCNPKTSSSHWCAGQYGVPAITCHSDWSVHCPESPCVRDPHPCGKAPGTGLHSLGGLFPAGRGFSSYFRLQRPLPSGRDLLRVASTLLQESSGNPQTHTRHSSTSDIGPFEFF